MKPKLAIVTTHPIQYNAPLFQEIAKRGRIEIKVFYTWSQSEKSVFDPGFGKSREWDIPLLTGYSFEFVENIAKNPGSHHYNGIKNPQLINKIQEWGASGVLIYGWNFRSHIKCLRYFHNKIPVYFRGDSNLLDKKLWIKKIFRYVFLKWVYSYVNRAFYVGIQNKFYYLKYGFSEKQLTFAPHAIDNLRFFDYNGIYKSEALIWRQQLNIPENHFVFLFAGKLEIKKDPEILIKSILALNDTTVHLVLVGNGELQKDLLSSYSKIVNLHFIDFQNQTIMPIIYRLADVFVLPSCGPGETWGLSVNEAMACGKPVIVSDKVGCAADLIEETKTGFTFKAGNEIDLRNKMQWFLYNRDKLVEMGKFSQNKISDWSYQAIAAAFESELIK